MSEFSDRFRRLSRDQRMKVREDMEAKARELLSVSFKLRATDAQIRAAAKKKVDIAFSLARRVKA